MDIKKFCEKLNSKKENIRVEKDIEKVYEFEQSNNIVKGDITQDLMARIYAAIDEWAKENKMDNLPRDIVMEQALLAISMAYKTRYRKDDR